MMYDGMVPCPCERQGPDGNGCFFDAEFGLKPKEDARRSILSERPTVRAPSHCALDNNHKASLRTQAHNTKVAIMATNDKYDRQLRLWGPIGQRNLAKSHVLLIQADAVGSETLKNLVLPGVGAFTILDDHRVTPEDLGNNFFVCLDSVGKPRAEVGKKRVLVGLSYISLCRSCVNSYAR